MRGFRRGNSRLRTPKGRNRNLQGAEYVVDFLPKVKIETVVAEDLVERAVAAIQKAAHTGKIGDAKVCDPGRSPVRIRTAKKMRKLFNPITQDVSYET